MREMVGTSDSFAFCVITSPLDMNVLQYFSLKYDLFGIQHTEGIVILKCYMSLKVTGYK